MPTTTTESTSTSPDTVERHVAFKFCLDPTQEQLQALARNGGAARYAYNMLVGYNAEVMHTRNKYWAKRREEGASDDEIKAELKTLTKEDPKFKTQGYMAFAKNHLTQEIVHHRTCAKAIEEGASILTALRRETGLHQLTKNLTTRYALIGIEDLNVAGMTSSASGTIENPGKNVAQKAGLNRAVLDVSFGTFRTQLEYKAAWYGSVIQVIDRYYPSSQTCSNCGERPGAKLTLSDRVYKCGHCHTVIDRDLNAAINIRREAERLYAEA